MLIAAQHEVFEYRLINISDEGRHDFIRKFRVRQALPIGKACANIGNRIWDEQATVSRQTHHHGLAKGQTAHPTSCTSILHADQAF